ncbi:hypothetical protein F5Y10DRAFT_270884 [Nemania abortiva]|nr:hypothetical protein F5Y10DRAFT_270884 [Nemania abortiva]
MLPYTTFLPLERCESGDEYVPSSPSRVNSDSGGDLAFRVHSGNIESSLREDDLLGDDNPVLDDADTVLFDGNILPPEFYKQSIEDLVEEHYDRKEYSKSTDNLTILSAKSPLGYEQITFKVIYNFLNWRFG